MSILGYSSSYFLPEYWSNTPLYGERIIPLVDYILSNEYEYADKLSKAYYSMTSKYKNPLDLPIEFIKSIINESGYSYVLNLLGNDENSIRLLVNLITMIHQLKGTKVGITTVLNLLRKENNIREMNKIGSIEIDPKTKVISNFSLNNYVTYTNFVANNDKLSLEVQATTSTFPSNQCILSVADKGLYIGIDTVGRLVLSLSSNRLTWDIANGLRSNKLLSMNTTYSLRLVYDGYEYYLQVMNNRGTYETWVSVESNNSLNITNGTLYLGVDATEFGIKYPFNGSIKFTDTSIDVDNIEIIQWFEKFPIKIEEEDTFLIKTDLDAELISTDFFSNFSNFVKNYVYPSLQAFTASLNFNSKITFLPYIREKVDYIAMSELEQRADFLVKQLESSQVATDNFDVISGLGDYIDFSVFAQVNVISASKDKYLIVEGDANSTFKIGDRASLLGTSSAENRKRVTITFMTYNALTSTSRVNVSESLVDSTGGSLWKL